MEKTTDLEVANQPEGQGESWSFLPYEEEQEVPRRELQLIRAIHSLIIPITDIVTITIAVKIGRAHV